MMPVHDRPESCDVCGVAAPAREVRCAAFRYVTGDRRILDGPACPACGADTLYVDGALCVRCEALACAT